MQDSIHNTHTDIPAAIDCQRRFSWKRLLLRWESLLLLLLFGVNVMNFSAAQNYGDIHVMMNAIRDFMDKAVIVFPMALLILAGKIDISVGSSLALSSVVMGLCHHHGMPLGCAVAVALCTGALCGFINGLILFMFKELSPMIVTLATLILYRGLANVLLENQSVSFPVSGWFSQLYWGDCGVIPYPLLLVIAVALLFGYWMHGTALGRYSRSIGSGTEASLFSGIRIGRMTLFLFTLTGIFAGLAAVLLASKMGSTRADIAKGYEMDVIAMVVLGGFSTNGGKGNWFGALLAIPIIGLLRYGLGMMNIGSQAILIIVGGLLVLAAAIPGIQKMYTTVFCKRKQ